MLLAYTVLSEQLWNNNLKQFADCRLRMHFQPNLAQQVVNWSIVHRPVDAFKLTLHEGFSCNIRVSLLAWNRHDGILKMVILTHLLAWCFFVHAWMLTISCFTCSHLRSVLRSPQFEIVLTFKAIL